MTKENIKYTFTIFKPLLYKYGIIQNSPKISLNFKQICVDYETEFIVKIQLKNQFLISFLNNSL